MPPVSDLVRDSKLQTSIQAGITRHVIETSEHGRGRRRVRKEQKWQRTAMIGQGSFGRVWKETLLEGESDVTERAVKMIRKPIQRSEVADYSRELEAMAKFSHPKYRAFFVESYGWFESEHSIFITMEFLPYGDLQKLLRDRCKLLELEVQQISFQILEGLACMHENGFAHRDLKPSNILIREMGPNWWVKIADFGISKRAEEGVTQLKTFSGTLGFLAPEIMIQNGMLDAEELTHERGYTFAVDIWSVGEIVFRCLSGESPFETPRSLASYVKGKTQFPLDKLLHQDVSEDGQALCRLLMAVIPDERPTASMALENSWFALQKGSPRSSLEILGDECASLLAQIPSSETANGTETGALIDSTEASACWSTVTGTARNEDAKGPSPKSTMIDYFEVGEVSILEKWKEFSAQEKLRVADLHRQKQRDSKAVTLNGLKKFSQNFKLRTPVPTDSVTPTIRNSSPGQAENRENQSGASMHTEALNILSRSVIAPNIRKPESRSSTSSVTASPPMASPLAGIPPSPLSVPTGSVPPPPPGPPPRLRGAQRLPVPTSSVPPPPPGPPSRLWGAQPLPVPTSSVPPPPPGSPPRRRGAQRLPVPTGYVPPPPPGPPPRLWGAQPLPVPTGSVPPPPPGPPPQLRKAQTKDRSEVLVRGRLL